MNDDDSMYLTYHDTTLHQSDLDILSNSSWWLTDRIIAFWFEYLTHELFKDFENNFLFMDPNMIFMIRFSESTEDLKDCMAPLKVGEKSMIFMPINDNNKIDSAGGSHWALLVFKRETGEFDYYDSSHLHNAKSARAIATKILPLLVEDESQVQLKLVERHTPQQTNGYDCGLYVCTLSEYVAKKEVGQTSAHINEFASPGRVQAKRKQMKDLVIQLKLDAEKAKSGGAGLLFSLKKKTTTS